MTMGYRSVKGKIMPVKPEAHLSRRERQIMDIVYAHGEASVNQVWEELPTPPSRTATRTLVRILEDKGHLRHRKEGREFIYRPTHRRESVARSALDRVLNTFYNGSIVDALAAQLFNEKEPLNDEQLEQLGQLIREARSQGR